MKLFSPFLQAFALALALAPASVLAQTATPDATAATTATPAPTAKKAAATVTPPIPPKPPTPPSDELSAAQSIVDSLSRETAHRTAEARAIFDRGRFDSELKPKIGATMDRAIQKVELQLGRVREALVALEKGTPGALDRLGDEVEELAEDAYEDADEIAEVRTHGGETEDNLQKIATEIRAIGHRAEELAQEIEDRLEAAEERQEHIEVRVRTGDYEDGDRVVYGSGLTVDKGETVKDAVAFGGPVIVHGDVEGDAVSMGGDVKVSASGHVKGDAASFGGRVEVEEGGQVDGEITDMPMGKIPRMAVGPWPRHHEAPKSWPTRFGESLLWAGVEFVVFFLLGMLALAAIPERTETVARAIETAPVKAAGFGFLLTIALPLVSVLLAVTIVGIIPMLLLLWPAAVAATFIGYVALALVVGRHLKTGVLPTPLALFAIGAAVIVVVGVLPFGLGWILRVIGVCFALGAVVMTRFGSPENVPPPSPPAPTPPPPAAT